MKLVTYRLSGAEHVGALTADGKGVLPLPAADMNTLIETMTLADLRSAAAAAERGGAVPLSDVELLAPIPRPRQDVVCLGMNYRDHAEESARYSADAFTKNSTAAVYFSKRVSEAGKPDGVIPRHAGLTDRLDYEAELAVVLGKAARDVKAVDAADCIFGYTVLNDVSARDLQTGHKQWYFGKSLDDFTPIGPWIVTKDEFKNPPALPIRSYVNGELRQDSNTELMINGIEKVICELTQGMTLQAGTIIAMGTPAGVGMGFQPPKFLKKGDIVKCEIEGIGSMTNKIK